MSNLCRWDIYEADVPFRENQSKSSRRPVLVIAPDVVLVLKMTTHRRSEKPKPFEYEISKWKEAGLTAKTFVQCDYFIKLPMENFTGNQYGRLQMTDIVGVQVMMRYHGLLH